MYLQEAREYGYLEAVKKVMSGKYDKY